MTHFLTNSAAKKNCKELAAIIQVWRSSSKRILQLPGTDFVINSILETWAILLKLKTDLFYKCSNYNETFKIGGQTGPISSVHFDVKETYRRSLTSKDIFVDTECVHRYQRACSTPGGLDFVHRVSAKVFMTGFANFCKGQVDFMCSPCTASR